MGYHSKPDDTRRQGRATASAKPKRELVRFVDSGSRVVARLGVITVGEIGINPCAGARHQYFWVCTLPMSSRSPMPASDLDAAKRAVAHKVEEWCDAAGVAKRGTQQ